MHCYLAAHISTASALIGHACEFEISPHSLTIVQLHAIWSNIKSQELTRPALRYY